MWAVSSLLRKEVSVPVCRQRNCRVTGMPRSEDSTRHDKVDGVSFLIERRVRRGGSRHDKGDGISLFMERRVRRGGFRNDKVDGGSVLVERCVRCGGFAK